MSDEEIFLQEIAEQPHDWFPRLVFADWLEEQSDPRAELIRLSYDLTRFECEHRQEKEARLQQLREAGISWPTPELPNSLGMKFVLIPPGEFLMGSPADEVGRYEGESQVPVTLTHGFWLSETPVTQSLWESIMNTHPWNYEDDEEYLEDFVRLHADNPAVHVDFDEVMRFCVALTSQTRKENRLPLNWRFSLPTETQWEYACRSGTSTRYSFGDELSALDRHAWYDNNSWHLEEYYAHSVGKKLPNPWGLYDMHGNVWEWCREATPDKVPEGENPAAQTQPEGPVAKGGSFCSGWVSCRSAYRNQTLMPYGSGSVGFRVALTFKPEN